MNASFSQERKKIDFHRIPKRAISLTGDSSLEHPCLHGVSQAH